MIAPLRVYDAGDGIAPAYAAEVRPEHHLTITVQSRLCGAGARVYVVGRQADGQWALLDALLDEDETRRLIDALGVALETSPERGDGLCSP